MIKLAKVEFVVPSVLNKGQGEKKISLEASDLQDAFGKISEQMGDDFKRRVFDHNGKPRSLINIYINNQTTKLLLCAWIVAFFPILSNTTLGLNSVDRNLRDLFKLNGATRWQQLRYLRLPAARFEYPRDPRDEIFIELAIDPGRDAHSQC